MQELVGKLAAEAMRFGQNAAAAEMFISLEGPGLPMTCPVCGKGPYKRQGWARRHYQRNKHAWWETKEQ